MPEFVVERDVPDAWPAEAPGAADERWRYWLYDTQVDRREGRDAVYRAHAYEARSTSQLGDAGRFSVSFSPGHQALRIHHVRVRRGDAWHDRLDPAGISLARRESEFERDLSDGEVTALVVLQDIRVGDVVHVGYTVTGANPILDGQASDWATFAWHNPVLDAHLRVLMDPGTVPAIHRENGAPRPVVRTLPDAVEVSMHAHASPAMVDESGYPGWYQPFPLAQVTARRDWSDVVDWALPLYPPVDGLPADLEGLVAGWKVLDDPAARLQAALRAVQDDVRYFGVEMGENTHRPVSPPITWTRRYGDCKDKAYLLVTVLDRLGIRAVPALVSTHRGRAIRDFAPTAAVFDHVIVRAELPEGVVWVDPTRTQEGGDVRLADTSHLGFALPVAPGVASLEEVARPERHDNAITTRERFEVGEDGRSVELAIRTTYRGRAADRARRTIGSERPTDVSRRYSDYYRRRYGELSVIESMRISDDRPANAFVVQERYRLAAPVRVDRTLHVLPLQAEALQPIAESPRTVERTGPLEFAAYPTRYRHEIEIDVPEAWEASFKREALSHRSPAYAYSREVEPTEDGARVVYEMDVQRTELAREDVAAHLSQLKATRESLWIELGFHASPASLDAAERRRRLEALLKDAME
ncbi:DUF3857 domain-containing protein [Luteimonas pelagia]